MARAAAEVRVRRTAVERDQLREILAGLADPVVAVDQFGEVVLANPSAERLLRCRRPTATSIRPWSSSSAASSW